MATKLLLPRDGVAHMVESGLIEDTFKKASGFFKSLFKAINFDGLYDELVGGKNAGLAERRAKVRSGINLGASKRKIEP